MIIINRTEAFAKWLRKLKDRHAKAHILNHIDRMQDGNMGNIEPVGEGVYEKKINYGPGYRLYYCKQDVGWVLLLCGGDKSTQQADINTAKELRKKIVTSKE